MEKPLTWRQRTTIILQVAEGKFPNKFAIRGTKRQYLDKCMKVVLCTLDYYFDIHLFVLFIVLTHAQDLNVVECLDSYLYYHPC